MKICVGWLGRPSASPYEEQVSNYRQRVQRRWPADDRPLKPVAGGRDQDPVRILRREAEMLERLREPGWRTIALDERGRVRTSEKFAAWLGKFEDHGIGGVLFVVGSDLGLHSSIVDGADEVLSVSAMTMPHLLARLVLWEQLYRATQILGGGAYHRICVQ